MTQKEIEAVMDAHEDRHHRKTDGKLWTFANVTDKILRITLVGFMAWFALEVYKNKGNMTEIGVVLKQLQATQKTIIATQKDFQVWKASTTASRFTAKDGAALLARHVADIDAIKDGQSQIIKSIAELPSKLPPAWVVDKINDNAGEIKTLREWQAHHGEMWHGGK